jgi:hypothetical protein
MLVVTYSAGSSMYMSVTIFYWPFETRATMKSKHLQQANPYRERTSSLVRLGVSRGCGCSAWYSNGGCRKSCCRTPRLSNVMLGVATLLLLLLKRRRSDVSLAGPSRTRVTARYLGRRRGTLQRRKQDLPTAILPYAR